jgi:hypothetical protein
MDAYALIEGKRTREEDDPSKYWNKKGLYQATLDRLIELKYEAYVQNNNKLPEKWWLLDATVGLYRRLHQDGDDFVSAAKNGKILYASFRSKDDMRYFVIKNSALLPKTLAYINFTFEGDPPEIAYKMANDMMDEIALYYQETYVKNKVCYACDKIATVAWETMTEYRFCGKECALKTWSIQ